MQRCMMPIVSMRFLNSSPMNLMLPSDRRLILPRFSSRSSSRIWRSRSDSSVFSLSAAASASNSAVL